MLVAAMLVQMTLAVAMIIDQKNLARQTMNQPSLAAQRAAGAAIQANDHIPYKVTQSAFQALRFHLRHIAALSERAERGRTQYSGKM